MTRKPKHEAGPSPTPRRHAKRSRSPSSLKAFCRSLSATVEGVKWGDHLTFSVGLGTHLKMYAGFNLDDETTFAFKCDDDDFDRLTTLPGIIPAPYSARFGWVKVERRDALPDAELRRLLTKARALALATLPARVRAGLAPRS